MNGVSKISVTEDVCLISFNNIPRDLSVTSQIMTEFAVQDINIDMISMAPTHGATTGLSFTISDEDLIGILGFTSKLKQETDMDVIVSSVNHKISVYDPVMKNTPGIAAQVFRAISGTDADIRLITTSEVEISLLVTEADFDTVLNALQEALL